MARETSTVLQNQFDKTKLKYPFKEGLFEIQTQNGKWCQTTRISFRSYDGPRRINNVEYNGPIFVYGTNYQFTRRNDFQVVYSQELKFDKVNKRYY